MNDPVNDHREAMHVNKVNWDERTLIHVKSKFYDVPAFKKGKNTLNDIELKEVGDVQGKSLLHLQCHFGLETMSWARLGAMTTGVDFSPESVELATEIRDDLNPIPEAHFKCYNVYDLEGALDQKYDIVYVGIGSLCWLPNLLEWAHIIATLIKPGGMLYILDLHPIATVFERQTFDRWVFEKYPFMMLEKPYYRTLDEQYQMPGYRTYVEGDHKMQTGYYTWQHSLGEIVSCIASVGLQIEHLHEFPMNVYKMFNCMERHDDGWWRLPIHNDSIPQLFSIKAYNPNIDWSKHV